MEALQRNPLRYTDIQLHVTVASGRTLHSHTLNDTLKWLQDRGYIKRQEADGTAYYHTTRTGTRVSEAVSHIRHMAETLQDQEEE